MQTPARPRRAYASDPLESLSLRTAARNSASRVRIAERKSETKSSAPVARSLTKPSAACLPDLVPALVGRPGAREDGEGRSAGRPALERRKGGIVRPVPDRR